MLAFSLPFTTSKAGQSALPTLFTPTLFFIAMLLFGRGVEGQGWVMPMNLAAVIARIDPIVNPGGVANHVHNIVGGSGISKDLDISALANSDCSTSPLQADKSAYWAPQLYYRYPDNTLAPLMGNSRIYYFIKEDQQDVKPFPPGFRMISGNQGASRTPNSYESRGVQISCAGNARTPYMPNNTRGACGSISMGIFFPSCGLADGSLDSDDHFSHMAWPITNLGGGATQRPEPNSGYCPPSHPIKYPTIFLEHNYYLREGQPWRKEDNLLVLSNGDTVGTSYHADFVNGWDQDVLTRAIKECRVGDNLAACPVFAPSYDVAASQKCRMKQQVPSESVGLVTKLDKLPGCNPLWPASAGDEKPGCDNAPATPGFVWPNAIFNNLMYRWGIPAVVPQAKVVPGNGRQTVAMWDALAPSYMGAQGQSSVRGFGTGGSSIADIVAAWVNSDGTKGFNLGGNSTASASASANKSSASASKSASASASKSASASASKSAAASASKSASVTASIRLQSSSAAKTTAKTTASTAKASSASATKSASKSAASASPSPESYDDGEYHCVRKTNTKRGVDAHKAKRRLNLKTRNHKARLLEEE